MTQRPVREPGAPADVMVHLRDVRIRAQLLCACGNSAWADQRYPRELDLNPVADTPAARGHAPQPPRHRVRSSAGSGPCVACRNPDTLRAGCETYSAARCLRPSGSAREPRVRGDGTPETRETRTDGQSEIDRCSAPCRASKRPGESPRESDGSDSRSNPRQTWGWSTPRTSVSSPARAAPRPPGPGSSRRRRRELHAASALGALPAVHVARDLL